MGFPDIVLPQVKITILYNGHLDSIFIITLLGFPWFLSDTDY